MTYFGTKAVDLDNPEETLDGLSRAHTASRIHMFATGEAKDTFHTFQTLPPMRLSAHRANPLTIGMRRQFAIAAVLTLVVTGVSMGAASDQARFPEIRQSLINAKANFKRFLIANDLLTHKTPGQKKKIDDRYPFPKP